MFHPTACQCVSLAFRPADAPINWQDSAPRRIGNSVPIVTGESDRDQACKFEKSVFWLTCGMGLWIGRDAATPLQDRYRAPSAALSMTDERLFFAGDYEFWSPEQGSLDLGIREGADSFRGRLGVFGGACGSGFQ